MAARAGPHPSTNSSIFLKLRDSDPAPREFAWEEFEARYAPILGGFARRLGAKPQDVDDVVQEVLLGFFLQSPTFVYDPSKGRFRSYLKVCAYRAVQKRFGAAKLNGKRLDEVDAEEEAIDHAWNDVWEQEQLREALEEVRRTMGDTKTFRAFEQYVVFEQPAQAVAEKLDMHINSVYRAKEEITRLLQERIAARRDED